MIQRKRKQTRKKGAAIIELAVTLPILLLFLLGIVDGGQYVDAYQTVSNASREGARVAAKNGTTNAAEIDAAVMDYLADAFPSISPAALGGSVNVTVSDGAGATMTGSLAGAGTGSPVRVSVSMEYSMIRAIPGLSQLDSRTIQSATTMCRE